jgi:hypothetical protein
VASSAISPSNYRVSTATIRLPFAAQLTAKLFVTSSFVAPHWNPRSLPLVPFANVASTA